MSKKWKPWAAPIMLAAAGFLVAGSWHMAPAFAGDEAQHHANELSKAFRAAAEHTVPTVVTIEAKASRAAVANRGGRQFQFRGPMENMIPDELREFMERGGEGGEGHEGGKQFSMPPRQSMGSGVIIDPSGVILTNNHVVAGADEVTVHLADGREFKTKDIKTDPKTDLAVVRLSGVSNLPAAKLGNSDSALLGDWVIAVGAPFGLDATVSAGIVSNTSRELADSRTRTKYLQTDAAINPGNSGGPLVNLDGEVIGINTAIATSNGSYQGVGFAIPTNTAKWVTEQLVDRGSVQRAYLGVIIQEVTPQLAAQFGVKAGEGIVVSQVFPKSPAAEAGIKPGDVITRFAGKSVASLTELQSLVERSKLDSKQSVDLVRNGRPESIQVAMEALPDDIQTASFPVPEEPQTTKATTKDFADEKLGFEAAELNEETAQKFGFDDQDHGVVVTQVQPESLAAEAGLQAGALIVKVKDQPVANLTEFKAALEHSSLQEGVLFLVRDGEFDHFVVLRQAE